MKMFGDEASVARDQITIGDLVKSGRIADEEVRAAASAFLMRSEPEQFAFSSGHHLNLRPAVEAVPGAIEMLRNPDTMLSEQEGVVREAIRSSRIGPSPAPATR